MNQQNLARLETEVAEVVGAMKDLFREFERHLGEVVSAQRMASTEARAEGAQVTKDLHELRTSAKSWSATIATWSHASSGNGNCGSTKMRSAPARLRRRPSARTSLEVCRRRSRRWDPKLSVQRKLLKCSPGRHPFAGFWASRSQFR